MLQQFLILLAFPIRRSPDLFLFYYRFYHSNRFVDLSIESTSWISTCARVLVLEESMHELKSYENLCQLRLQEQRRGEGRVASLDAGEL